MKQTLKATEKNKPFLTLSGKSAAGWGGMIVFSFIVMFFIGTLVGRGSIKVDLGQKKIVREINSYAESMNSINDEAVEIIDDTPDLVFYETLQKKETPKAGTEKKVPAKPKNKVKSVVKKKTLVKKPGSTTKEKKVAHNNPLKMDSGLYKYSIQIASFKGIKDAEKTVARFKQKGYSAYCVKAVVRGSEVWYRVRIGAFKDRIDAKATLLRLEKNKIDGFLVTR